MKPNDIDKLGSIIKNARLQKNLTREQLAEKLNISIRYLMFIENENKKPSYDVLFRLIRFLGISADSIFFPESVFFHTDKEHLIRMIHMCNESDFKILLAVAQVLINNK